MFMLAYRRKTKTEHFGNERILFCGISSSRKENAYFCSSFRVYASYMEVFAVSKVYLSLKDCSTE